MNSALRLIVVGIFSFVQLASPIQRTPSHQTTYTPFIATANSTDVKPGEPAVPYSTQFLRAWYSGNAPVAFDDSYDLDEDTVLTVSALTSVLANDLDNEADPLAVALPVVSEPGHGDLEINVDGSFTYTPEENFNGQDSFTYMALDDTPSSSTPATVTLNVAPINDDPSADGDSATLVEDGTHSQIAPGLLENDSDLDLDEIAISDYDQPEHGSVTVETDGAYLYTPDPNYAGADAFTYTISDGNGGSDTATASLTISAVNDAPQPQSDAFSTTEDTSLEIATATLLENDEDVEESPLALTDFTQPAHGDLVDNLDDSFTYTPDANYSGSDSFTYTVSDSQLSGVATVYLTVTSVNDLPAALDDSFTTNEDTPLNVSAPGVLANDSDVEGPLSAVIVSPPAAGTLSLSADGSFSYTPAANAYGMVSFTYRTYDGAVYTPPAMVTITISAQPDAPVAQADSISVTEDGPYTFACEALLSNDFDADGESLSVDALTDPTHGSMVDNGNGTLTYTPDPNYNGTDTCSYRALDPTGRRSTITTITVNVAEVNDLPTAEDDSYAATEDTTLTVSAPGVLSNDFDLEGPLTAVLLQAPATGTLSLSSNGGFSYTPMLNANGAVTFTYRAYDGSDYTAPVTVTINIAAVNDAPVAANDSAGTNEDTALNVSAPGVLANDSDVDSSITAVLLSPPATGTLTLNANGSYTYTPVPNANGVVTFTYRAYDGALYSAAATVTITINPVPDAPVAGPDAFNTNEDTPLTILKSQLLVNDSDPDGSPLDITAFTQPVRGQVVEAPAGTFTYTPTANTFGADSFTYTLSDGSDTATGTVTLTVAPVNDLPTAGADSYAATEDTPLSVAAPGVLVNDSDVEGPLTAVLLTPPATGTISLNSNGAFTYTPVPNANGVVTFTYRAYDGSAYTASTTVTINIAAVNDTPVAGNDTASTNEDTPLSVAAPGVLSNDSDVESSITAVLVSPPATGSLTLNANGSYSYTPAANANGIVTFTYQAYDGVLYSTTATVTITIVAQPDAPVAQADSFSTDEDTPYPFASTVLLGNDSDADGEALTVDALTDPPHGTVVDNGNGTFTYTPDLNYNGADSFTYRALDPTGRRSAVTTVNVTVNPVNDAPVAVNDSFAATEDTVLNVTGSGVLVNDSDVDSSITAVLLNPPATGTLTLNANGTFTYTPVPNANGAVTFTYRAYDGVLYSAPATVTINLAAVNDAPVAVNDNASTNEDVPLTVASPGVLGNDSDIDSTITAALLTPPATGTLALNANGGFTYTPAPNANGVVTFTYRAYDGALYSAAATVMINLAAVNDAPVAVADAYAVTEDTPFSVAAPGVMSNDSDVENSPLTATRVAGSGPNSGALVFNNDGSFTYTPAANFNGVDSFSYSISDGTLNSNTVVVTLNVAAVNDQPVAAADAYSTAEDTPLVVAVPGVLQNDSDVDSGTVLTAAVVTPPASGTLVLNANGSFSYTPALNFFGPVTFTYRANDGAGQPNSQSAPATVTITVTAVNDAPVALDQNVATPEDTARAIALSVSDVDTTVLQYTIPPRSAHGTLSGTAPNLTYTPDLNYFGADSFTYTVSDGNLSDTATVNLTVSAVNDAPAGASDSYTINEDGVLVVQAAGVLSNDSDVDSASVTSVIHTPPAHGTLTLNTNGSFTYTPAPNYNGADSFIYRAYDGSLYSPQLTVTITVNPVNDLPVALGENYTINEDTPLVVAAAGLLSNDTDVDGDTLQPVLVTAPARGDVEINNNGAFTYTPDENHPDRHIVSVVDSFTYRVFDGTASSATVTVSVTIKEVNDAPITEPEEYDVGLDGYIAVQSPGLLGNDRDIENDALTIELVEDTEEPGDLLTLHADGSFEYIPYPNMPSYSSITFTYRAYDAQTQNAYSEPTSVTIHIMPSGGPQLAWLAPVATGNVMKVGAEEVPLSVLPDGCQDTCIVRFFRYTATGTWVDLGILYDAPYTTTLDTNTLNLDWNQIYAVAIDPVTSNTSPRQRILLKRYNWGEGIYRMYIPGVSK